MQLIKRNYLNKVTYKVTKNVMQKFLLHCTHFSQSILHKIFCFGPYNDTVGYSYSISAINKIRKKYGLVEKL